MSNRICYVVNALTGKELQGGVNDVNQMFNVLTDDNYGGCDPGLSLKKHDCQNDEEFNKDLSKILNFWNPNNQLILYYSGHGIDKYGLYCLEFGENGDSYYPFDNLMNKLKIKNVKKAIIILDACYSESAFEKERTKGYKNPLEKISGEEIADGIEFLGSSRSSQTSHELEDGSASLFTHLMLQILKKGLDSGEEFIYADDIVQFVNGELNQNPSYNKYLQWPIHDKVKSTGKLWLSKNPKSITLSEPNFERDGDSFIFKREKRNLSLLLSTIGHLISDFINPYQKIPVEIFEALHHRLTTKEDEEARRWIYQNIPIKSSDQSIEDWYASIRKIISEKPETVDEWFASVIELINEKPDESDRMFENWKSSFLKTLKEKPNYIDVGPAPGEIYLKTVLDTLDFIGFVFSQYIDIEESFVEWLTPPIAKTWERIEPYVSYEAELRAEPDWYESARFIGDYCVTWRRKMGYGRPAVIREII